MEVTCGTFFLIFPNPGVSRVEIGVPFAPDCEEDDLFF
jgi:hypothetical protein